MMMIEITYYSDSILSTCALETVNENCISGLKHLIIEPFQYAWPIFKALHTVDRRKHTLQLSMLAAEKLLRFHARSCPGFRCYFTKQKELFRSLSPLRKSEYSADTCIIPDARTGQRMDFSATSAEKGAAGVLFPISVPYIKEEFLCIYNQMNCLITVLFINLALLHCRRWKHLLAAEPYSSATQQTKHLPSSQRLEMGPFRFSQGPPCPLKMPTDSLLKTATVSR